MQECLDEVSKYLNIDHNLIITDLDIIWTQTSCFTSLPQTMKYSYDQSTQLPIYVVNINFKRSIVGGKVTATGNKVSKSLL